ncbi:hypothetical protein [Pseudoalteromonas mariniglutinosa]|uniref:hypothetical protein n=1 Tax=Pseudoalteromonas mariniglutinosa TaxID=206042 RepID=UPI00384ECC5A
MANKPISEDNPFANLSQTHCQQIKNWYQKQVSIELNSLLKGSKSGQLIEQKIHLAVDKAMRKATALPAYKSSDNEAITLKNANIMAELKDTRDLFYSAQYKINLLEQKIVTLSEQCLLAENKNSELKVELRSTKQRLNQVLSHLEKQGVSFQKSHYVGRIFVHALRKSFHDWQQTPAGEHFRHHDFYALFPRVLYRSLLKEIENLLGEHDYSSIERTLTSFVFQHKGIPVQNWPDEDPIYNTTVINQKQHELLVKLQAQHQRRKNFSTYLEKKLAKTGFTAKHSRLLMTLIAFANKKTLSQIAHLN